MKGSEFIAAFGDKGLAAWEAAALALARSGDVVSWPAVDLHLQTPDGVHTAVLPVAADLFAIGTTDDFLRLPLTPRVAQTIANLNGYLLPTPKLSYEIWKQAGTKLRPIQAGALPKPYSVNLGASMGQYVAHDRAIEAQRAASANVTKPNWLVTGHKKDIVVSNIAKPGKVLIYGWFWPDRDVIKETMDGTGQPIQPRSNVHGDFYVDYSHGVRFVSPIMTVDGQQMNTEDVYRDPVLSKLVSDEGPVHQVRYPASTDPAPPRPANKAEYRASNAVFPVMTTPSLVDLGGSVLAQASLDLRSRRER